MASFADFIRGSVDTELAVCGEDAAYSRPGNVNIPTIPEFTIQAAFTTSGDYATPLGPIAGDALVRVSDIPGGGPLKGDLITPSDSLFNGRTYRVHEIFWDVANGYARLMLRWPGAN